MFEAIMRCPPAMLSTFTAEAALPASASAQGAASSVRSAPEATIVLVHGAFSDASGWHAVIRLLQKEGHRVIAVQNSMVSLAGDIETTKRVIDAQNGAVVAVGHSYGGAVISGAAAGNANVKALVFVAAFAPEPGEPIGAFLEKYPSDLGTSLVPDTAGFLYIDSAKYNDVFAADVPAYQTQALAVTQKPIAGAIFGQSISAAAWQTIPSWYLAAQQDRSLRPELQRFYAQRMNARTTEIRSSHVPLISKPRRVARLIGEAAAAERS